jgi:predicted dinucleotide-binding enzyme
MHMKMGVLGSGMVAQGLSARLAELGHNVVIGTQDADKLRGWQSSNQKVLIGSFVEAASHGEMLINATDGAASLNALIMAGEQHLADKILIDVSNPLDFSNGFPPSLTVFGKDSLAEQIQRAFPSARVVKTLNTVTARVMTHPLEVANGDHHVFISSNDMDAKGPVMGLLRSFGWIHIFDLGDLSTARGTEAYALLWVRLYGSMNTGMINIKIMK